MPNKPESNYRAWLAKAGEDELSAGALVEEKAGAPSTVCFLSQQMAEKYLKGLLVFYGKEFLKVHDLIELETLLLDAYPEIHSFHEDLKTLNQYYVGTRYPADVPEFTFKECEKAFESALRIKEFVLEKIEPKNGFSAISVIGVVAILAILAGGGFFAYQYFQIKNIWEQGEKETMQETPASVPSSQPSTTGIDTSNWKTYRNEKYGFEVRYPASFESKYRNIDDIELTEVGTDTTEFEICREGTCHIILMVSPKQVEASIDRGGLGGTPLYIRNGYFYYLNNKEPELKVILSTFRFTKPDLGTNTSNWKTYRNEKYGFEFRYPSDWILYNQERGTVPLQSSSGVILVSPERDMDESLRTSRELGMGYIIDFGFYVYSTSEIQEGLEVFAKNSFFDSRKIEFLGSQAWEGEDRSSGHHILMGYENKDGGYYLDIALPDTRSSSELEGVHKQILSTFKFIE